VIIDPIDLKIIRQLEQHGSVAIHDIIGKFQISEEEILLRIKNFEDSGFITGYGMKLFIPGVTGGRWHWGCVACETTSQFKPEKTLPCLEEIVENLTSPQGVCPDHSLLFYTQNLRDTYRIINKVPGIKYAEVYKIDEYNVKVPKIVLKEDWQRIKALFERLPQSNYSIINAIINDPETNDDIKLSKLIWSRRNRQGVISLFPNFDWSVLKNYMHIHVAVTSSLRIKELRRLVNKIGFSGNIASRFKKQYIQLEFDIWGFNDLQHIYKSLIEISRITIQGFSLAFKNRIYHGWLKDYLDAKV
jgi:DNA-binding Lrp family transcriptional regulator